MKRIYFTILLLAAIVVNAAAQPVQVTPEKIEHQGNELKLTLKVHVDHKQMNRCDSWVITPELKNTSGTAKQFPEIVVVGSNREKMIKRSIKFGNTEVIPQNPKVSISKGNKAPDKDAEYTASIPYEPWMDGATLYLNEVKTSCADKTTSNAVNTGKMIDLPSYTPYDMKPTLAYLEPEKEAIKRRNVEATAYLDFQAGKSVILPDFRRNPVELAKIHKTWEAIESNPDINVTGIEITGFASPEGSYATNEKLSRERSEALKNYLVSNFNIKASMITTKSVGEDWEGLKNLMSSVSIQNKDEVLEIINNSDDYDTKERKLKALNQGKPYKQLLDEVFPQLRRVEYRVDFDVKAYDESEAKAVFEKDPTMLSNHELYTLARQADKGSAEQKRIVEAMQKLHPQDPATRVNSTALALENKDIAAAKKWADGSGDSHQAMNNKAVILMHEGKLDAAEEILRAAAAKGSTEAKENLEEIRLKRENIALSERHKTRPSK